MNGGAKSQKGDEKQNQLSKQRYQRILDQYIYQRPAGSRGKGIPLCRQRDIDKSPSGREAVSFPSEGKSISEPLKEAGISTSEKQTARSRRC